MVSAADIETLLDTARDPDWYDQLNGDAQGIARKVLSDRMSAARQRLNLAAEFTAEGRTYCDLDELGGVRHVQP